MFFNVMRLDTRLFLLSPLYKFYTFYSFLVDPPKVTEYNGT